MTTENITPEEARQAVRAEKSSLAAEPVTLTRIDGQILWAEYVVQDYDVVFHFFRPEGSYWTYEFGDLLKCVLTSIWRLEGREDQLEIEWVQEVYSWYARVKNVARLETPNSDMMQNVVKTLNDMYSEQVR